MGATYTLGFIPPEKNPLTGEYLLPGQQLVRGPLATGPRITVVSTGAPATWPRWITRDDTGQPADLGTVAGGTWDGTGAQSLPDLTTTAQIPWWTWLVALGVAYALVFGKGRGRREW